MNWLTGLFVAALSAEAAARLYLASRQVAAVRAHRDRVPAEFEGHISLVDQQKAADYTVARVRFGRIAAVAEFCIKLALTLGGGLAAVDAWVAHLGLGEPWQGCLVLLAAFVLIQALGLPFALWRTFGIEARFGFNRISARLFVTDLAKQAVLGLLLGAPLAWMTLSLMDRAGRWWWAWAWLVWLAAMLGLTWAAPRFIAPLFNRFAAITDAALERRVGALLQRCGFAAEGGIFVMDGSRRSAHGNAYFTGIGRHKRIVFFDTLLSRIEPEELEAVLAHELGHFRLHHVRQRLILSMVGSLGGLALLGMLAEKPFFYAAFGVPQTNAMALLVFVLAVPAFTFFAKPFESWWFRRHELAADRFAAQVTDARKLVTALVKLYRDNATTLTPDRLHSAFYDSHPCAVDRIAHLRRLSPA